MNDAFAQAANGPSRLPSASGFTLIELLVVLSLFIVLTSIAVASLRDMDNTAALGAHLVVGYFKEVRSRALSRTLAYTISPSSSTTIAVEYATTCDDISTTVDPQLTLTLPLGATMLNTSWSVCFSTRGLADTSLSIPIYDPQGGTRNVELVLGGAARVV